MKIKLLIKLRNKFPIVRNVYGNYMVEGSSKASSKDSDSLDEIRKWRRIVILNYARLLYSEYSVLRNKTFN